MSLEEEHFEEALRRIREAERNGATTLDLSWCRNVSNLPALTGLTSLQKLNLSWSRELTSSLTFLAGLTSLERLYLLGCGGLRGDLTPLSGLTSLQTLNLGRCWGLSGDLSPLAGLTSLQSLNLSGCGRLSGDLSPLAGLTSLQAFDLSECTGIRKAAPSEPVLPQLQKLYLYGCPFDDLPSEICGLDQNVIHEVRAHFDDLKAGRALDAELKLFILGNGGVGKTQLARRLRDLDFDERIPTTHGIELNFIQTDVDLEQFQGSVRLNLWDFGGQDIYHGSHTLFLHGQAIFLLLWNPKEEEAAGSQQANSTHRPITYWLDYLRAVAGTDNPLIAVQSRCDTPAMRASIPVALSDWGGSSRTVETGAKTGFGPDRLKATLKDAAWACLHKRPPPPIGKARLEVRDRLREMLVQDQARPPAQRQHRLLERQAFDQLCAEVGRISDTEALLGFLHHNGAVFYRLGLFHNQIILDQNWAMEAIYSIFHRDKCLKQLKKLHGRFSREDLELLVWSGYEIAEQEAFLGMMESCAICFKARELPDSKWEYIAPELLPEWADTQEQLLGRLRDEPPDSERNARYPFLHEGILRSYLSRLGKRAKDAAIYWKYGCWFYEQKTSTQALIQTHWDDREAGAGSIRLQAWGQGANELVESCFGNCKASQPDSNRRLRAPSGPAYTHYLLLLHLLSPDSCTFMRSVRHLKPATRAKDPA